MLNKHFASWQKKNHLHVKVVSPINQKTMKQKLYCIGPKFFVPALTRISFFKFI